MLASTDLIWGPFRVSGQFATNHFLVTGTTGSGKTTLVEVLLSTALSSAADYYSVRALMYDPKQEMIPYLDGLGLFDRVRILHPFDERRLAWDLSKDFDDPISCRELAGILIPKNAAVSPEGSFFDSACRQIVADVATALSYSRPKIESWSLRDLILICLDRKHLSRFVESSSHDALRRSYDAYLNSKTTDSRTSSNVFASLYAHLARFEPIAQSWHLASKSYSIQQWMKSTGEIIVLGSDTAADETIGALNRAFIQRWIQVVLQGKEQRTGDSSYCQSWLVLDELRELGQIQGLGSFMTKSRSRGGVAVLSFQAVDGLYHIYGREQANEIVANFSNVAVLKTASPSTAEWAAGLFGKVLVEELQETEGMASEGLSRSFTRVKHERSVVMTGDLLSFALPTQSQALEGLFRVATSDNQNPHRRVNWGKLLELKAVASSLEGYLEMDRRGLLIERLGLADEHRLGLVEEANNPTAQADTAKSLQDIGE